MRQNSIVVIESLYHAEVTEQTFQGISQTMSENNMTCNRIQTAETFELPQALRLLIESVKSQGFEATDSQGKPIQRPTGYIISSAFIDPDISNAKRHQGSLIRTIQDIACYYALPVSFGLITATSLEEALKKASPQGMNRGVSVANSLLKIIEIKNNLGLANISVSRP